MTQTDNKKKYDCNNCISYQPGMSCYQHNDDTRLCDKTPDGLRSWYTLFVESQMLKKQTEGGLEKTIYNFSNLD